MNMDKHKIAIIASASALALALGGSIAAYGSYHTKQVNQISAQVQVANQQAQKANKAKVAAEAQAQAQAAKTNKIYVECLNEAKKSKDSTSVCAD